MNTKYLKLIIVDKSAPLHTYSTNTLKPKWLHIKFPFLGNYYFASFMTFMCYFVKRQIEDSEFSKINHEN